MNHSVKIQSQTGLLGKKQAILINFLLFYSHFCPESQVWTFQGGPIHQTSQNFITFIKIAELGRFPIVFDVLKTIMSMRKRYGWKICHGASSLRGASFPVWTNEAKFVNIASYHFYAHFRNFTILQMLHLCFGLIVSLDKTNHLQKSSSQPSSDAK